MKKKVAKTINRLDRKDYVLVRLNICFLLIEVRGQRMTTMKMRIKKVNLNGIKITVSE